MGRVAGARKRKRPWIAAAVASLVLHSAVVAVLVRRQAQLAPPPPPSIEVSLLRPDRVEQETTAAPDRPPPPDATEQTPMQEPRAVRPSPFRPSAPFTLPAVPARPSPGGGGQPGVPGPTSPQAGGSPRLPVPPAPGTGDAGERVRSFVRSAGCEGGSARLTPRERERCQERLGTNRPAEAFAPSGDYAKRRRGDEARRQARKSLFDDNDSVGPRASDGVLMGGGGGVGVMVGVPFGKPPPALPNIPPSTLRGDDDALRLKRKPEPKPAQPPAGG